MSAPARACASASLASSSSVASLSTSPLDEHAAVAVVGVLAQADVGDHHQVGQRLLDRAHRARHDAVVAVRLRAGRVLLLRNAEQDHRRDAEIAHRAALLHRLVDRQLRDARHRADRLRHPRARHDEQRQDELVDAQPRLAHHAAQRLVAPQPARSIGREFHQRLLASLTGHGPPKGGSDGAESLPRVGARLARPCHSTTSAHLAMRFAREMRQDRLGERRHRVRARLHHDRQARLARRVGGDRADAADRARRAAAPRASAPSSATKCRTVLELVNVTRSTRPRRQQLAHLARCRCAAAPSRSSPPRRPRRRRRAAAPAGPRAPRRRAAAGRVGRRRRRRASPRRRPRRGTPPARRRPARRALQRRARSPDPTAATRARCSARTSRRSARRRSKNIATPLTLVNTTQSYDSRRAIAASSGAHDGGGTISIVGHGMTSAPAAPSASMNPAAWARGRVTTMRRPKSGLRSNQRQRARAAARPRRRPRPPAAAGWRRAARSAIVATVPTSVSWLGDGAPADHRRRRVAARRRAPAAAPCWRAAAASPSGRPACCRAARPRPSAPPSPACPGTRSR